MHRVLVHFFLFFRTIILTIVLYGCETWSLTMWEERRLRVFENREERGKKEVEKTT